MAVLISSHILPEVEQVCDRVVILNRGRIVAQGRTEDLRRDLLPTPAHRVVAACSLAELETAARSLEPGASAAELGMAEPGWKQFRLTLPPGSPARDNLLAGLVRSGLRIREVAEERGGLEDIFLAATRRDAREARAS
ncbi:MAG: hypothetical protein ACO23N_00005 [Opitutales bacterium]